VKKVRKGDENCVEKLKKKPNFYAREGEVRSVFFSNKPMILLVYKEAYFNTDDLDHIVPSVAISLFQEFDGVFPDYTPSVVDENADAGEEDYDFASASQGIRSGPNRARRNVNFRAMRNYEEMDGDLDTIKLKIPNFQGKNDPEVYLEWEKR
jgi:hypothetical protein